MLLPLVLLQTLAKFITVGTRTHHIALVYGLCSVYSLVLLVMKLNQPESLVLLTTRLETFVKIEQMI